MALRCEFFHVTPAHPFLGLAVVPVHSTHNATAGRSPITTPPLQAVAVALNSFRPTAYPPPTPSPFYAPSATWATGRPDSPTSARTPRISAPPLAPHHPRCTRPRRPHRHPKRRPHRATHWLPVSARTPARPSVHQPSQVGTRGPWAGEPTRDLGTGRGLSQNRQTPISPNPYFPRAGSFTSGSFT